jgi:hypothetical protein
MGLQRSPRSTKSSGGASWRGAAALRQIAVRLNAEGVPAARGGTWFAASVRQMLRAGEG